MQPVKTALVGFGISGQCFQAPILQAIDAIALTAVVSSDAAKVHTQLPEVRVYPDIATLLADDSIELVIIATPNEFHFPYAKAALRAGKHVMLEKPFVIECKEGRELLAEAEQAGRVLSVYQSRRFDGDFRTLQKLIAEGALGEVHTFYSSYNRYRPETKVRWRESAAPGAGILYDLGAHLIDQAIVLFGRPLSVSATLRHQRPGAEAVDHFHLVLGYADLDVILHGNCLSTAEGPRFQLFGDKGAFIKYGMDPQEDFLRAKQGPESEGWGEEDPACYGTLTAADGSTRLIPTERGGYEDCYLQLMDAIRGERPVPVSPQQALETIAVIEAAYLSQAQQRTVFL
ncbi:oxidoreductase [Aeromonas jandaei]